MQSYVGFYHKTEYAKMKMKKQEDEKRMKKAEKRRQKRMERARMITSHEGQRRAVDATREALAQAKARSAEIAELRKQTEIETIFLNNLMDANLDVKTGCDHTLKAVVDDIVEKNNMADHTLDVDKNDDIVKTNSEDMATNMDEGFTPEDHESEKNIIENKFTLAKLFIILTIVIILKAYFHPVCWRQTLKAWSAPYAPYTLEEDMNRDTEKTNFENMALDDTNAEMKDEAAHNMNNWMKHNNPDADGTDTQHAELQRMQKTRLVNYDTEKTNFENMTADDTLEVAETNFENIAVNEDEWMERMYYIILEDQESEKNITENTNKLIKLEDQKSEKNIIENKIKLTIPEDQESEKHIMEEKFHFWECSIKLKGKKTRRKLKGKKTRRKLKGRTQTSQMHTDNA
jgi:hypothetical protein